MILNCTPSHTNDSPNLLCTGLGQQAPVNERWQGYNNFGGTTYHPLVAFVYHVEIMSNKTSGPSVSNTARALVPLFGSARKYGFKYLSDNGCDRRNTDMKLEKV